MKKEYLYIAGFLGLVVAVFFAVRKFGNRIVTTAKSYVGQKEISPNTGFTNTFFTNEMKWAGWYSGAEWCTFFARLVWLKSLDEKRASVAKKLLSGSSQQTYTNFANDKSGLFKVSNTPTPGAIVIWQSNTNKAKGHAGVVESVSPLSFTVIEGNRGDAVSRIKYDKSNPNMSSAKLRGFIKVA